VLKNALGKATGISSASLEKTVGASPVKSMDAREEHPKNAEPSIEWTLAGMVTEVRAEQ
jgi:hypothetical protein